MRAAIVLGAAIALSACGGGGDASTSAAGSPSAGASVKPGDPIWVAILASADAAEPLDADLQEAQAAVGDYLAPRVVVKEASCYTGLPATFDGRYVVAIQDFAEHGVHAMYAEITDDPPFYGPVTLAC